MALSSSSKSLAEQIARKIRRDILRGNLLPGSPIKERDAAIKMGVSRTPMREAVRILAQQGLIQLRPSRSPIVARPSFKELADDIELMIELEKISIELACRRAGNEDIARISKLADEMDELYEKADPLDIFEVDMSFHRAIANSSQNRSLVETYETIIARLWQVRYMAAARRKNKERFVNQHHKIVAAIQNRDPKKCRKAIEVHLLHLAEDIRIAIEYDVKAAE